MPEIFSNTTLTVNPKKKRLRLPVNIRKIGIQFAICQQVGIAHTAMLLEIAEMPLPPYPDWPIFLRLIIPGNQVIVTDQFIFQPCASIGNIVLHHQRLHPRSLYFRGFALATLISTSSTASVYRPAAISLLRNRFSPSMISRHSCRFSST